jgi:polyphenol oxidase
MLERNPTIRKMNEADFSRNISHGIPFYSCTAIDRLGFVRHGFSTRTSDAGLLSLGPMTGDQREKISENRRRFLAAIGLPEAPLATLAQIHSDRVEVFSETDTDFASRREGDAIITSRQGPSIAVQVADCFPVLVTDPESGVVAAVHSGWRGTASRILFGTLQEVFQRFKCHPARLLVAIGPGIRTCCMQVGPEVALALENAFQGDGIVIPQLGVQEKFLADLPRALAIQCWDAGIPPSRVFDLGACTRCRPDEFFSYRAEGKDGGRMMAVIGCPKP